MKKYDIVIVGAGPAGLFAAYELITNKKDLKILLLDKGRLASNRACPMNKNKIACTNCNPCQILSGFGGAGTFSDGKLNFIPKIGKSDLFKYMSSDEAYQLIDDTEEIFNKFNMDSKVYPSNLDEAEKIKKKIALTGSRLLLIKQKHLGSDKLPSHIINFSNFLIDNGVELLECADVTDISSEKNSISKITYKINISPIETIYMTQFNL